jgi:Zn-dependent M16 (insulinase) family peptidase
MFAMDALVNVLEYDYLYEKIRVEGGAYTCGAECFGNYLLLYSQRDPDIGRTYEVFKSVPEWLETVEFTQADIVQQTEGVAERFDLLNRTKGEILSSAIFRTMHKIKEDDVPKVMKCITDVKLEEVKNIVPLLKEAFKNSVVCAVSNEEEIKSNASLFDEIIDLRIGK